MTQDYRSNFLVPRENSQGTHHISPRISLFRFAKRRFREGIFEILARRPTLSRFIASNSRINATNSARKAALYLNLLLDIHALFEKDCVLRTQKVVAQPFGLPCAAFRASHEASRISHKALRKGALCFARESASLRSALILMGLLPEPT